MGLQWLNAGHQLLINDENSPWSWKDKLVIEHTLMNVFYKIFPELNFEPHGILQILSRIVRVK